MPRQDVPYGGAICRLKERIAEIWDKLGEKLHSINGVEGDGAGNVDIVSGNTAVVINNDQIGHRIEVGLDSSKLPAASVSSVNGQTGAVRLDAVNILSDGDSNVQADIDLNKAAINDCFDSITSEQTARQNADAALQTNINAVSASIPEMSTTPDPYKGVERDAQGRAFAADPESGATDKTLVTANWVSQTGDSAPNNLIHKNGNETKIGDFSATTLIANQTLRYANSIIIKDSYLPSNTSIPANTNDCVISVIAGDKSEIMNYIVRTQPDGARILRIGLHDTVTGANHLINLIAIKPDGTVIYPWS